MVQTREQAWNNSYSSCRRNNKRWSRSGGDGHRRWNSRVGQGRGKDSRRSGHLRVNRHGYRDTRSRHRRDGHKNGGTRRAPRLWTVRAAWPGRLQRRYRPEKGQSRGRWQDSWQIEQVTGWPAWNTRTGKSATDTDDGMEPRKDITRRRVSLVTDGNSRKKHGWTEWTTPKDSNTDFTSSSGTSNGRSRTNTKRMGWSAAVTEIGT